MPLQHILGVDHAVVAVRDLEAAASAWRALGFTLSPRGRHSANMGTANHTLVFGHDYLELMGIEHATALNRATAEFLRAQEGVERVAFTTDDAAALSAELRAHGVAAQEPVAFGRPVPLPEGGSTEARFRVTNWPDDLTPAGLHLFACQHETRAAVWLPALQQHANGVCGLRCIEIIDAQPGRAAAALAAAIGQAPALAEGGVRVPSGPGRADFFFLAPEAFAQRHPAAARAGARTQGAAALVLACDTLAQAARVPGALAHAGGIEISAALATGVLLRFVLGA